MTGKLLKIYHGKGVTEQQRIRKQISDLLSSEEGVRSKRDGFSPTECQK